MQAGQTSVRCVGLAVGRHKEPAAVAPAGTEAPRCSTAGLVAALAVTDSAVPLLAFASPDLL